MPEPATTDTDPPGEADVPAGERRPHGRGGLRSWFITSKERWAFRAGVVLVILPVWVAAIRDGLQNWYPTLDAATTVLKARDVVSAHPPLIGMWASVSNKSGIATYFPGATELYVIGIPIHFLGNSWGPLLGMAVLNSTWLVIGAWLLRRRLGSLGATWALLALALLVWTMGSESLVDVSPMQMVTIPFAVFLIAVWSVADGDLRAIWALALVANFCVLNHLVLTMLIPTIGLCAPIGLAIVMLGVRRRDPDAWPSTRHRLLKNLGIGLLVTLVLWIPPLIQEFRNSPGNLTNLWRSAHLTSSGTHVPLDRAVQAMVRMLAQPPFWFRDSFSTARDTHPFTGPEALLGLFVLALLVTLGVLAYRRRDRVVVAAMGIALVAIGVSLVNITIAPTTYGFKRQYFRSLWGVSMFVWLAAAVGIARSIPAVRRIPERLHPRLAAGGLAGLLVVTLLALPHKSPGPGTNGTDDDSVALAQQVIAPAVADLEDRGQVRVTAAGNFSAFRLSSSLLLALDTAGVNVCVQPVYVEQHGERFACAPGGPDTDVLVTSAAFPPQPGQTVIAEATLLTPAEQREHRRLAGEVAHWLSEQESLEVTPSLHRYLIEHFGAERAASMEAKALETNGLPLESLVFSEDFVDFIIGDATSHISGNAAAVETGDLPARDLIHWAELTERSYTGQSVRIVILDEPVRTP